MYDITEKLIYCSNGKRTQSYVKDGKMFEEDECQSLFESNPFEPKLVQENKDGRIEPKENKADLINALCSVLDCPPLKASVKDIAKDKLQKLLESL